MVLDNCTYDKWGESDLHGWILCALDECNTLLNDKDYHNKGRVLSIKNRLQSMEAEFEPEDPYKGDSPFQLKEL